MEKTNQKKIDSLLIRDSVIFHTEKIHDYGVKQVLKNVGAHGDAPNVGVDPRVCPSEISTLENLKTHIGDCTRCPLHKRRQHVVFGEGNPKADLMFVGEGPGADEDEQGLPFVGRAGQLLTKMIHAMGYQRKDVYIANVVKCLRYNAMIQLGDGSWERIGRLVSQKYNGTVMSVDSSGRLVQKRVIDWHASPLADRAVYKLTYQSAKQTSAAKCGIFLTGDHPVLTQRGYVPVQELDKEDRIATGQGLSPVLKNLIYGSLLGDGHIASKNAHFSFSHSLAQGEYARFKAFLLEKELGCTLDELKVAAGSDVLYPIVKCYTRAHRSLWQIRRDFYSPKKRVPHFLVQILSPMMLAFWFMDDGYMRIRSNRQPLAEIATCAFLEEDLQILIMGLKRLGLEAYERRNRLFFNVAMSKKLSEIIAPYVLPSMRYKLHPEISQDIPFNETLFEQGDQETFFDKIEVTPAKYFGTDKTFYCIDVEETHNFVTSGGVVHNCRPPNNRNPEPVEIETCFPFLKKQITIISPKVIVCLGKFAAQMLLETQIPISRLRGKFQDKNGIAIMPTFHPSYLLRSPEMKKYVWEDLKQVMARLAG